MSNASDFVIKNGVLKKYTGPGGDVIVPDSVTSIGMDAFMNNKSIASIQLPAHVSFHPNAFNGCKGLANKDGFVIVNNRLFDYFGKGKTLAVPDGVKEIMPNACMRVKKQTEIILPDSAARLWGNCFGNTNAYFEGFHLDVELPNLKKVVIPDALTQSLGIVGLKQNFDLGSLMLALVKNPEGFSGKLKEILISAIQKERYAVSVIIRSGNVKMMKNLLSLQKSITSKKVDQYIKEAEKEEDGTVMSTFLSEYKTKHFSIKKISKEKEQGEMESSTKQKSIAEWREIFRFSAKNGEVTISGYKGSEKAVKIPAQIGKNTVVAIGAEAFVKDKAWKVEDLQLPNTIREIGKQAFFKGNITNIILPDTLATLCVDVFGYCSKLESISLPTALKAVPVRAFKGCANLKKVDFNNGLETICGAAFCECNSLEEVSLPESVMQIDPWAFAFCGNLKSITIQNPNTVIMDTAFSNSPNLTIHAPTGSCADQYAKEHNIPFVAE